MNLSCPACGKRFRSASAEARHRHNFPAFCRRNKRFLAWLKSTQERDHREEKDDT